MTKCWQPKPTDRPTFKEVRKELETMLESISKITGTNHKPGENLQNSRSSTDSDPLEEALEVYIPTNIIPESV